MYFSSLSTLYILSEQVIVRKHPDTPSGDVLTFWMPQTPVFFLSQAAGHAPDALLALSFVGNDL